MILHLYICYVIAGLLLIAVLPFVLFLSAKLITLGYLRGKQLFEQTNTRRANNENEASARKE